MYLLDQENDKSQSEWCQVISGTVKPALTATSVKRSPAHNSQFLTLPTFFTI